MKRYKLKKDIPAFKAGTECYIEDAGHIVPCRGISYTIVHKDQLEKNPNILNEWFEEIKEPLIKDEKIRNAVRAWAEACCIEVIEITHSRKCILRAISAITGDDEICIDREIGQILDEKVYNIDELCGEDEE